MIKRIFTVLVICLILGAVPAWAVNLKPGKFEITATVEMPGMPSGMPPQTTTQCLTDENLLPGGTTGGPGCEITDMKTRGNTLTYTIVCDQQGSKMKGTGSITYNGTSFEGKSQITMGPEAGGMVINTLIIGKRIGNCN